MASAPKLTYFYPGWFAISMGLSGLALAWSGAAPLMGEMATGIALVLGAVAAAVYLLLLAATLLRWQRHPQSWADDRKHPVRHSFIATLPISTLLMAALATTLLGRHPAADALWWAGSLGQWLTTCWVLSRWWRGASNGGLSWASVTPALILPVVGNVLAPLAGVALGHPEWAAAQFGVGLLFWPVVLVLLLTRVAVQGMFAERLLPSLFILVAPPAVVGLAALQLGAPMVLAWGLWGMALFMFCWAASQAGRIRNLPFSVTHWGLSFPLAALAALTLRLASPGGLLAVAGPALLALVSIVVLGLVMGTLRGLRDGTLLAPEPVAPIIPVTSA